MRKLNIAVVGSGIAGLSAAWLLSKNHNVQIFEKEDYPGGHSNTRTVTTSDGDTAVDTGFIVYNEENYPNLTALFDHLDVETAPSNMSFSYSQNEGWYEYSGTGVKGIFGQKSNLFNYGHWHMLRDIRRFFATAPTAIKAYHEAITIGEFLTAEKYSKAFREDHEYQDESEISFDSYMLRENSDREELGKTDLAEYPRLLAVDNELVVPVDEMIRVLVTADVDGVLHSFAMPAFGLKMDAVPGRLNETWFKAREEGIYYGQCSELCGKDHAFMPIAIRVVSKEQFETWKAAAADDVQAANEALMASIEADKNVKLAQSQASQ